MGEKTSVAKLGYVSLLFLRSLLLATEEIQYPSFPKNVALRKEVEVEVEVAVGWVEVVFHQEGMEERGGSELRWFGGGLGTSVPRQRTGPTLVRAALSEVGDFLEPTKSSRSHVQGYTAGMAILLSVNGSKVKYNDSPVIVLGSASLTSTIPTRFTRRRNEIGSSLLPECKICSNL